MSKKFSHINTRGTGAELVIKPFPAWNGEEGSVKFTLSPQKGIIDFKNDDSLEFFCTPNDIAKILCVFRGIDESVNDGMGILRLGSVMKLEHRIEPLPGFVLSIGEKDVEDIKHLHIVLDQYEALELCLALEGLMSKLVFGM